MYCLRKDVFLNKKNLEDNLILMILKDRQSYPIDTLTIWKDNLILKTGTLNIFMNQLVIAVEIISS